MTNKLATLLPVDQAIEHVKAESKVPGTKFFLSVHMYASFLDDEHEEIALYASVKVPASMAIRFIKEFHRGQQERQLSVALRRIDDLVFIG